MTPSRKRGRNHQDDESECMPLSKRINNLHINSNMLFEMHKTTAMNNGESWRSGNGGPIANYLPDSPPLSVQSVEWNQSSSAPYNPELTEVQNPFYYSSNKLLYEMYMARQERNSL